MRYCCALLLMLLAPGLLAEPSLQERLGAIRTLQGDFSQRVLSEDGQELESSSGQFKLLRPGFFSWHIRLPDEQLLLATGSSVLHYDVELETATRREVDDTGGGPLALLSGGVSDLEAHYEIEQLDGDSYRLRPKNTADHFLALSLTFSGELPSRMTVRDQLLQTTVIEFTGVQLDPDLVPADFEFTPPEGVDYSP